jgi:hypothetical protein
MARLVNIPVLNDFVYTLLFNASYEQKRGLKGKYLKAAMDGRSAKIFASTSTREEKEFICAHFGVEFFYVMAKRSVTFAGLRDILEKFEVNKKVSAIRDISELGICVTSDKEFLRLLGLMSQSIHHHSFFLNMEFQRQGYHIQKWSKNNLNKGDLLTREVDESAKILVKTALNACLVMTDTPGMTGITEGEMKIMLYLYVFSNTYVEADKIYAHFVGRMTKQLYRTSIKRLIKSQYIQQHGQMKKKEYTITGQGISKVYDFVKSIFSANAIF